MPSFLHSQSLALNDTLNPKKKSFSNMRRTYKGYDVMKQSGSTLKTAELFEALLAKLVALGASLFEVSATIGLTILPAIGDRRRTGNNPATINDRFLGATSSLIRQTKDIEGFTSRKLENNLNIFSPSQISEISEAFTSIQGTAKVLDDSLNEIAGEERLASVLDAIQDLTESWEGEFNIWEDKFEQLIVGYNQGVGTNADGSADIDVEGVVGAGFAHGNPRVGETTYGYDLKLGLKQYLPRRFV